MKDWALEKTLDDQGNMIPTLIKIHEDGRRERMGNVDEFDELFAVCEERWDSNWDLPKLLVAIRESQID